jgi:signal transduction histidine kinase
VNSLTVAVLDDGRGGATESSGLRNLRERAQRLGGDCEVSDVEPSGTRVDWHVPI